MLFRIWPVFRIFLRLESADVSFNFKYPIDLDLKFCFFFQLVAADFKIYFRCRIDFDLKFGFFAIRFFLSTFISIFKNRTIYFLHLKTAVFSVFHLNERPTGRRSASNGILKHFVGKIPPSSL